MDEEQIRRVMNGALAPVLQTLRDAIEHLDGVERRLHAEFASRLQLIEHDLAERNARQLNAMAVNDARFAALTAYVSGGDVEQAFARVREQFEQQHPVEFDAVLWRVEPAWLKALRRD